MADKNMSSKPPQDNEQPALPDSPESQSSMTDVLERIQARASAAGHPVTVRVPPRRSGRAAAAAADAAGADGRPQRKAGGADNSDYDVESAKKLLAQAQRRTDVITSRQAAADANAVAGAGAGAGAATAATAAGGSGSGVLAAAGQWLFGRTEQRRRDSLARQVEEQRRRLRRAIKRNSVGSRGSTKSSDLAGRARGSDQAGGGGGVHHHRCRHHHHHSGHHHGGGGGGICSAITGVGSFSEGSSSSSSGASEYSSSTISRDDSGSEVLVDYPIYTGSGFHVNLNIPESPPETPITNTATTTNDNDGNADNCDNDKDDDGDDDLPMQVVVEVEEGSTPHILNSGQMKSVAMNVLPPSVRYCRWKRLYSLSRDGDSFLAFLRHVDGWKRTLMAISTSRGEIFGAYADSPWENQHHSLGATFYGSAQACLWRVPTHGSTGSGSKSDKRPEVIVYKWTGANRYIQICDPQAKLIAFGGGGEGGDFGLCVEDDFRRGSTGRCETFGNEPLCEQDQFDIVDLECYGFPAGFS